MKKATFYILETNMQIAELSALEALVCYLSKINWRKGKRVLIACEDKKQATRLDKSLWKHPIKSFTPHNLAGEGPKYGAPVELSWPQRRGSAPRDLLINLLPKLTDFPAIFHEVIDFVPCEQTLREKARDRYKTYRSIGFQLNTESPPPQSQII